MRTFDSAEDITGTGSISSHVSTDLLNRDFFPTDEAEDIEDLLGDADIPSEDGEPAGIQTGRRRLAGEYEAAEDLVQTYFHSMGDISILSRDEEVEIAKKLEEGREIIKETMAGIPLYKTVARRLEACEPSEEEDTDDDQALKITLDILGSLVGEIKEARAGNPRRGPGKELRSRSVSVAGLEIEELLERWETIRAARAQVMEARNELITRNLRLVINIAKNYIGRGLPILDLIQEGNIGLMRVVEKFRYEKGFKFSTYATWWIRQAITRAIIDQTKTVRVPVHIVELYNKVTKTSAELAQELGREPSNQEVGGRIGLSDERIADIRCAVRDTVALQTPIGDEDTVLEDFLADENTPSPYADAEKKDLSRRLLMILKTLKPREEEVIKMRFGIGVDRNHTLEEVGKHLLITRERVRQIEAQALRKLRRPVKLGILSGCPQD